MVRSAQHFTGDVGLIYGLTRSASLPSLMCVCLCLFDSCYNTGAHGSADHDGGSVRYSNLFYTEPCRQLGVC